MRDIREALLDDKFRSSLPEHLAPHVQKFLSNPSCSCNRPLYDAILKDHKDLLRSFFPDRDFDASPETSLEKNHWKVINTDISKLESVLRELPPGRKQLSMSRYQDQVTVVVNELDLNDAT